MRLTFYLWMVILSMQCMASPQKNAAHNAALTILTQEHAPLNFKKDGKVTGQAAEVVKELMKRTDTHADIRSVPWEEGYRTTLKEPNTVLFATVMTPVRKELFQWVGPVTVLDTNLYAIKGSNIVIKTLDDAKKVSKIATITDYYSEQVLKKEGFTNLQSFPDEESALKKLLSGDVQLLVSDNTAMPTILKKAGLNADTVVSAFTVSTDLAYIAFSKNTSSNIVSRWQKNLDAMKRDGSFDKIYVKWLPGEIPPGIFQMVTEEYPPVTFMKDGKPAGFVTDIVRQIALRLKAKDNIRLTSWKNAYNMAILHPNVILFSAERTPQREGLFQWIGPVGKNSAILYAKKGSKIKIDSLEDAKKVKAIATTTDWFTEQYLKSKGFTNLVSSKDPAENLRQLMNGKVQLSIFTDLTIPEIAKSAGYSMNDLEPVYTVSQTYFYIAISKDTKPSVIKAWQTELDKLKKDGTFEKIYKSYLPDADMSGLLK
ncbi:MAG: transporter substrate-binding domain-containing protein [Sulfurovaceae bacterium]|nr:transporter substrate-binding domain-containing protein [Sulfurovaceae bacterium]